MKIEIEVDDKEFVNIADEGLVLEVWDGLLTPDIAAHLRSLMLVEGKVAEGMMGYEPLKLRYECWLRIWQNAKVKVLNGKR